MPIGRLNTLGCPITDIEVSGPIHTWKKPFEALIDTGFSGFLSLPMIKAFPLGLMLHGTTTVILADGSKQSKFTCLGEIHYSGKSEVGVVIIEPNSDDAIVGMEFLKKFGLVLAVVTEIGAVALIPSEEIKPALPATTAAAPAVVPQSPESPPESAKPKE